MTEVLKKANALSDGERFLPAHIETFIEGPRWAFGPLWLDQQVLQFNEWMTEKGWEPIKIIWQREEKSWLRKGIMFRLEGQAYPLQAFGDVFTSVMEEWNA